VKLLQPKVKQKRTVTMRIKQQLGKLEIFLLLLFATAAIEIIKGYLEYWLLKVSKKWANINA